MANALSGIGGVLSGENSVKVEHIVSIPPSKVLGTVLLLMGASLIVSIISKKI